MNMHAVIINRMCTSASNDELVLLGNIHVIIEHKSDVMNKCKGTPSIRSPTQALFIHSVYVLILSYILIK
jgi:hypothetical protein